MVSSGLQVLREGQQLKVRDMVFTPLRKIKRELTSPGQDVQGVLFR